MKILERFAAERSEAIAQMARAMVVSLERVDPIPIEHLRSDFRPTEILAKRRITRRFIARSAIQVLSVTSLGSLGFAWDACAIYRGLVERFFLYGYLAERKEFAVFDDWCFFNLYKQDRAIESDKGIAAKPNVSGRSGGTGPRRTRFKQIQEDQNVTEWRAPDVESLAEKSDLRFLHTAGFSFASSCVHPTAYEGVEDIEWLLTGKTSSSLEWINTTVGNAQLMVLTLANAIMVQPEYLWMKILQDHVRNLSESIATRSQWSLERTEKIHVLMAMGKSLAKSVTSL